MAAKLAGYRRGGRFNRGYITPEGAEISYREYRNRLELTGAVQRLGPVELANARRRQRAFNDIVNQMSKVRARSLDAAMENTSAAMRAAEAAGENDVAAELAMQLIALRDQAVTKRGTPRKREVIKSQTRKEALRDLERFHHKRDAASELKVRAALITLGRREGVPDWFPVGSYDRVTKMQFQRAA